jgi:anion-transporting  ArsA/GET3 family ATPase
MSDVRVVVCCGTGGVGKTTAAAALALSYAMQGKRTVVLTIDPAKRLADALGMEALDNRPAHVPLGALATTGGSLDALMLDRKATWDETIRKLSADEASAETLLSNRYYRAVSTKLTGSHEYMAAEKLYQLAHDSRWEVVVVDTPPSQHAIEFFNAPDRVRRLFDRAVLSSLISPKKGLAGSMSRRMMQFLMRLVGQGVMEDIGEFFRLISGVSQAFAEHSAAVQELLSAEQTDFYLVTSPAQVSMEGALAFVQVLRERHLHFAGFLLNRFVTTPDAVEPTEWTQVPDGIDAVDWETVSAGLRAEYGRRAAVAERHGRARLALSRQGQGAPVWPVPLMDSGLNNLDGLASLAAHLPPSTPTL